jgi:uncharacterized protein YdaU (DUF1376 family)
MDTFDLRADEVGVYVVLLMLAWKREDAALPNDPAWLKRALKASFSKFHGHAFNRIVPRLLAKYFELGADGLWRNKRLTNERQTVDKRSANGSQMIRKRWSETRKNNNLADTHSQSHSQSYTKSKNGVSYGEYWDMLAAKQLAERKALGRG